MKLRKEFFPRYSERLLGIPASVANDYTGWLYHDDRAREAGMQREHPGPFGAITAAPFTVAFMMLCCAWQGVARSKAAKAGWLLWNMPGDCPVTGQANFGNALQRLLSDHLLAEEVVSIELSLLSLEARIQWSDNTMTRFVQDETRAQLAETDMRMIVHWPGKLLHGVACDIRTRHDAPETAPATTSVGATH